MVQNLEDTEDPRRHISLFCHHLSAAFSQRKIIYTLLDKFPYQPPVVGYKEEHCIFEQLMNIVCLNETNIHCLYYYYITLNSIFFPDFAIHCLYHDHLQMSNGFKKWEKRYNYKQKYKACTKREREWERERERKRESERERKRRWKPSRGIWSLSQCLERSYWSLAL